MYCLNNLNFTCPCRVEFVPCNKQDMYVIEIHVKPGERGEIYSDSDSKVCSKSLDSCLVVVRQE